MSDCALEHLRDRYLSRSSRATTRPGSSRTRSTGCPAAIPEDRTRQICNAWKSDSVIAAQVFSERTGRLGAQLVGYRGVRILQDNVLWKPPGTKAIGFHQDSSYADYLVPSEMLTCWISLHETTGRRGTDRIRAWLAPVAEVSAGAHAVPRAGGLARRARAPHPREPSSTRSRRRQARRRVVPPRTDLARLGAEPNAGVARMALVSHLIPVEARFHETNVDLTYSRYRRQRRPLARRVVLPGALGRVGLPHALAPPNCRSSTSRRRRPDCGSGSGGLTEPRREHLDQRDGGSRIFRERPRAALARVRRRSRTAPRHGCRDSAARGQHLDLADQLPGRGSASAPAARPRTDPRARAGASASRRLPRSIMIASPSTYARSSPAREIGSRSSRVAARTPAGRGRCARSGRRGRGGARPSRSARTRLGRGRASGRRPSTSERRARRDAPALPRRAASRARCSNAALSFDHPPREVVRQPALRASRTLTPNLVPSCSWFAHACATVDGDEDEWRPQGDRHERVRGHPVHLLTERVVMIRDAGGEHAERPPEGDRRVTFESAAELERLGQRRCVERGAECLGRRDRGLQVDRELLGWDTASPLHGVPA